MPDHPRREIAAALQGSCGRIPFAIYGHGIPLILSHPLRASATAEDPERLILQRYLERLVDRYRVLVMDYPNGGTSEPVPPGEFTADRACADLLNVADAAGFSRFVWWGYSWGGALGVQLAFRTERVAVLVCGGWAPIGALHVEMVRSCHAQARVATKPNLSLTFYESLLGWPEAHALQISCPRIAYAGSQDEVDRGGVRIRIAAKLREHREQLEAGGWEVREIPEADHSVWMDPGRVVPMVRGFLDRIEFGAP